jgi:hypothetical protein
VTASLTGAFPGAQITSGQRSPAHNAAVGGFPTRSTFPATRWTSPPPGVTLDQVKQHFAKNGVTLTEAINEGDHFHIAWGPKGGSGGARVVAEGNAKPDMTPQQQRQSSVQLRKEFDQHPDVKQFQTVATQYGIVSRLANQPPTAANDISMIFAYMKLLDPTSVVREGEFATAQNATGIPGQVANAYNKALKGERLNPEQRRQFTAAAGNVYGENKPAMTSLSISTSGYARDTGLPENVIQPRVAPSVAPPGNGGGAQAARGRSRSRERSKRATASRAAIPPSNQAGRRWARCLVLGRTTRHRRMGRGLTTAAA